MYEKLATLGGRREIAVKYDDALVEVLHVSCTVGNIHNICLGMKVCVCGEECVRV